MRPSPGEIAGRTVAGLVGGLCALLFLWFAGMVVVTDGGPHGYLLFFGGVFAFGVGLLGAFLLPLAFPSGSRLSALGVSLLVFVAILVGVWALVLR